MVFLNPRCWAVRAALALAALLLAPTPALSAGLGQMAVASALGQPLNAEIEVLAATPGDVATLSARLAHPDAYREAGLEYAADLTTLQFTVVPRGNGRAVIQVTSSVPIVEPVLNLLLEVSWVGGKLQRRYAALLDPPGYGAQVAAAAATSPVLPPPASAQPAPVIPMPRLPLPRAVPPSAGVPAVALSPAPPPEPPATKPVAAAPPSADRPAAASASAPAPRAAAAPAPPAGSPGTYGPVRRGETLGQIARQVAPEGATLPQALAALYAENPRAFLDENMNRLMAGAVLRVPTADQITAIPADVARAQLAEHLAGRRATLAELGYVPQSRAAPREPATARGRVASAIDSERLPAPSAGTDTLRLSRGPGESGAGSAPERVASKQDELSAREQTVRDARARIVELQQQIRDVERLLALAGGGQGAGAGQAPASGVVVDTLPSPLAAPPVPRPAGPESAPPTAAAPAGPASAPGAAPGPPPPAKARPPAPPPGEPTLLDRLQGDLLWAAALVVILVGVGAIVLVRRLQRPAPAAAAPGPPKAPALRGAAAPVRRPPVLSAADEADFLADLDKVTAVPAGGEPADPVAEADSLITYGRYVQAEEVLRTALGNNANQPQVALRLLELQHAKKDAAGFAQVAQQLKAVVGESSAVWRKASELGAQIDPGNRLYGPAPERSASMPTPEPVSAMAELEAAAPAVAAPAVAAPAVADAPVDEAPAVVAPEATPADVPPLDFVAGILTEPPKPSRDTITVEPVQTDLPALDLPSLDFTAPASRPAEAPLVPGAAASPPVEPLADGVGTRLDLAKAYLDIGDKEGARDLLREVVRSGSAAQRAEAEKLLGAL